MKVEYLIPPVEGGARRAGDVKMKNKIYALF